MKHVYYLKIGEIHMKNFAILLTSLWAFLMPVTSQAVAPSPSGQANCIDASVNNIPTAYSLTDVGSLILSPTLANFTHLAVTENTLSADIVISDSTSQKQAVPTSSFAVNQAQLPLESNVKLVFDGRRIGNAVMVRSRTGSALSSGKLCVAVY